MIKDNPKKVKKCEESHPLKKFTSGKMRQSGDDFFEGRNLKCDVCGQRILNLAAGYMTCEDVCNYDCHMECYDWTKE